MLLFFHKFHVITAVLTFSSLTATYLEMLIQLIHRYFSIAEFALLGL